MPAKAKQENSHLTSLDSEIAERVRNIRVTQGVTQAKVAGHLGIVHQQYHKYEAGVIRFSAGMLIAIAEILDCPLTELVPPRIDHGSRLDPMQRIDVLRMRVQSQIDECRSEQKLLAISTLLTDVQPLKLVVDN